MEQYYEVNFNGELHFIFLLQEENASRDRSCCENKSGPRIRPRGVGCHRDAPHVTWQTLTQCVLSTLRVLMVPSACEEFVYLI